MFGSSAECQTKLGHHTLLMKLHFIILVPNIFWRSGGSGDRGWIWFYKRYPQINFHHKQPFPYKMTGGVIEPGQKFVSKQTNEIIIEFLFWLLHLTMSGTLGNEMVPFSPSHFRQYFLTPFRNPLPTQSSTNNWFTKRLA